MSRGGVIREKWFPQVEERLADLLELPSNWNGYGEQPVDRVSAIRCAVFLSWLAPEGPPPEIVPVADGRLQMEWHMPCQIANAEGELSVEVEMGSHSEVGITAGLFYNKTLVDEVFLEPQVRGYGTEEMWDKLFKWMRYIDGSEAVSPHVVASDFV